MRRRTFDALVSAAGLVLAAVLLIGGGLLLWGHSFVTNEVHSQLAAQKIVFPANGSPGLKELPASDAAAMSQYAGQLMTNGAQAETYADHFIAVHLVNIGCPPLRWQPRRTPRSRVRCRRCSAVRPCGASC
jgi:hypothetical protein